MLWELWGTDSVVCCGNCREQIVLGVVGIVGNRYFCVLWELWGPGSVVCCGNCREHISDDFVAVRCLMLKCCEH